MCPTLIRHSKLGLRTSCLERFVLRRQLGASSPTTAVESWCWRGEDVTRAALSVLISKAPAFKSFTVNNSELQRKPSAKCPKNQEKLQKQRSRDSWSREKTFLLRNVTQIDSY